MRKIYLTIAIFIVSATSFSYALDVKTHKALNEYIATNQLNGFSLDSYITGTLGIASGITTTFNTELAWQWLRDGGIYEDEPPGTWPPYRRSRNHFHNPLLPLDQAGYTGFLSLCGIGHCPESAVLWAQGPQNSDFYSPGGDWSWKQTRLNFYTALTAAIKSDRDTNFANTFRGLGQIMHLVQDMSVPEHTRNSFHAFGGYEGWVLGTPWGQA